MSTSPAHDTQPSAPATESALRSALELIQQHLDDHSELSAVKMLCIEQIVTDALRRPPVASPDGGEDMNNSVASPSQCAAAVSAADIACSHCDGQGFIPGDPEGAPIEGCDWCSGTGKLSAVEAVARAIHEEERDAIGTYHWAALDEAEREGFRALARAAIKALAGKTAASESDREAHLNSSIRSEALEEAARCVQKMIDDHTHEHCTFDNSTGAWEGGDADYLETLDNVLSAIRALKEGK